MRNVALFGGTFNPPTLGHELAGVGAFAELDLSELLVLPNSTPPHKVAAFDPGPQARLGMCQAMCDQHEGWRTLDWEIVREGVSYTQDTLVHFANEYPDAKRWFLCGTDSAATLAQWHGAQEFHKYASFAVVRRQGEPDLDLDDVRAQLPGLEIVQLHTGESALSSTLFRDQMQTQTQKALELLAPPVAHIVSSGCYYRPQSVASPVSARA